MGLCHNEAVAGEEAEVEGAVEGLAKGGEDEDEGAEEAGRILVERPARATCTPTTGTIMKVGEEVEGGGRS
jgi:hypothetical protein